ncbi:MAG: hypothetical protein EHM79_08455 [Geobacter sp.]|nr:MAG: hypothetical protein EHM79_08455 [Geobacter sp.]
MHNVTNYLASRLEFFVRQADVSPSGALQKVETRATLAVIEVKSVIPCMVQLQRNILENSTT